MIKDEFEHIYNEVIIRFVVKCLCAGVFVCIYFVCCGANYAVLETFTMKSGRIGQFSEEVNSRQMDISLFKTLMVFTK